MKPLSHIIESSIEFVNHQFDDEYDKYSLEELFKRHSSEDHVMKRILEKWSIDESKIILLEGDLHDNITKAEEFKSISDIETHLKKRETRFRHATSFFLPIVYGELKTFKMFDENKNEIIGHKLTCFTQTLDLELKIIWDEANN